MTVALIKTKGMDKKVYVIGHKNPDTDSIVAAAAYAKLKQTIDKGGNYVAARAGKTTPQTEYVFTRFQTPMPRFVADLVPKVAYYYNPSIRTITQDISLWEAMSLLQSQEARALPVVDDEGRYHSLLHYSSFAQKLVKICNPQQKTTIQTSVTLLAWVLHAQVLVENNPDEVRKSPIVVAAADIETFKEFLAIHIAENTIVVSGDRLDVQEHAIAAGVRALIITNGNVLSKELREKAEEKGVSVLISPYDTSSTTMLLIFSMPASCMSNADLKPVSLRDPVRKIAPLVANAPGKALPVVNSKGVVIGVISENDLYHDPHIEIIMVDHNEQSQAVEGIENYKVREIIDHHRLGNLTTRYPITFINMPVGATCTIVASLYKELHVPLDFSTAAILLCGILADTLILQSATTTDKDREIAEYLSNITNLEIGELGKDVVTAASNVAGRSAEELIQQDMKKYAEGGFTFFVSQIEVGNPDEVVARKDEFLAALTAERQKNDALFAAVLVTDITRLSSLLFVVGDRRFEQALELPKLDDSVYIVHDVVSRKKQLMPILSEVIERMQA